MKKQLLALAMAAVFTTPAFAAENTGVVVNGVRQAGQDLGNICEENALPLLPVRLMAAQCGITAESGSAAIPLVKSIAAQAGLEMRWNADTKTAYFMDENRILYESGEWKAGVLLPRGCAENSFRVAETQANGTAILHFFDSAGEMLVFSLMRLDLDDWENEIKENFAAPYSEVYRNHEEILLCINASDVQYDPDNPEQKAEYEALLAFKDEICASFYTFTA